MARPSAFPRGLETGGITILVLVSLPAAVCRMPFRHGHEESDTVAVTFSLPRPLLLPKLWDLRTERFVLESQTTPRGVGRFIRTVNSAVTVQGDSSPRFHQGHCSRQFMAVEERSENSPGDHSRERQMVGLGRKSGDQFSPSRCEAICKPSGLLGPHPKHREAGA